MLNYNHLHYFHVVASEGSIAAAAERMGVTQPTISEQVRTLERSLGSQLFDRQTGGWRLTDAGKLAYEQTSVMFRAGERLVESLGHRVVGLPKTLRVGISTATSRSTSSDFLMPLFAIEDCLPSIRTGDAADLVRSLRANDVDLVLADSEPVGAQRNALVVEAINTTTLVAVTAPTTLPNADWSDVGLVNYRATTAHRWDVEAFLDSRHLKPRIVGEADDPMFLVEAAARGGFIVVVPRSVARDAIRNGRLVVLEDVVVSQAGVYALYLENDSADLARRAVSALVAHMRRSDENFLESSTS